jgi:hypothetical protein
MLDNTSHYLFLCFDTVNIFWPISQGKEEPRKKNPDISLCTPTHRCENNEEA